MNRTRPLTLIFAFCASLGALHVVVKYWTSSISVSADVPTDAGLVEIVEVGEDRHSPPIVLRIPQEFRFRSSVGQVKTNGINLITFYPAFTSLADQPNRQYALDCIGDCNGQIMISIENVPTSWSGTRSNRFFETGYGAMKDHKPKYSSVRVEELQPQFGFDRVFDEVGTIGTQPSVTRYLLKPKSKTFATDLTATCSMSTPYHICQLYFSLACAPTVDIKITGWAYERFAEALELQRRVDQFVTAMLVEPNCDPNHQR